jgi:ribosome maturation factor RimP
LSLFFYRYQLIPKDTIQKLVEEALTETQFVVDLWVDAANKIYVEVDDVQVPISITDCIQVSRGVEHNLDREVEDFALEVTSPGLSKPFKVFQQYVKNIGRDVTVTLITGTSHKGTLIKADEEEITLEWRHKQRIEGRKAKEWVTTQKTVALAEVKETFVEIVFK